MNIHSINQFFNENIRINAGVTANAADGWPVTLRISNTESYSGYYMHLTDHDFIQLKNAILQADRQLTKQRKELQDAKISA